MRRYIDVSLPISPYLATFPGNPAPAIEPVSQVARGAETNVSELRLGSHTGTHVDAPAHLFDGGPGADAVSLEALVGEAYVADARFVERFIGGTELEAMGIGRQVSRVLLLTRNSAYWRNPSEPYPTDYVALSPNGAQWLVERHVRLVGTDALSIEPFGTPGRPTHRALLDAEVAIVEGLDLSAVEPGSYTLICLPLRVAGGDGSPARAILVAGSG